MVRKMICGGVYESNGGSKIHYGTMISVTVNAEGKCEGTLLFHGMAPERISEDSLRFEAMTLVGRPASPKMGRPRKE
jgi:hypothetical protein